MKQFMLPWRNFFGAGTERTQGIRLQPLRKTPAASTIARMDIAELNSLRTQVLWAAFAVAIAFGAIVQRTQF